MKRSLIFIILTLVIIIGGIFLLSRSKEPPKATTPLPTANEYFWGDGCPHCANVEEFLKTWEEKDKVIIDKKEVWGSSANAKLMSERAAYCNLETKNLGVPFLFTPEGKCFVGDEEIIEYLKSL